jgi:hypothetical protein
MFRNLYEQIKELKRLLKPSDFNRSGSNFKSFDANITALFGLMTCQSILALFKSDKILLKRRHAIRKVLPMKFDSFYVSLLSENTEK